MDENPENDKPYAEAVDAAVREAFVNAAKMVGLYYHELIGRGIPKDVARDITLQFTSKVHDKINA